MNIVITGMGLIGKERIKAVECIKQSAQTDLTILAVVDPVFKEQKSAVILEKEYPVYPDLQSFFDEVTTKVDWVFICTPHFETTAASILALQHGTSILVEKPLGRNIAEYSEIVKHKKENQRINVGFNYRFFKGVSLLMQDALNGVFGDIISVNMTLAHGNSPGMEKSWKLDPVLCGGGCLIDPGIHLIDLAMLLSKGTLKADSFLAWDGFWKTGIEEEVHLLAKDYNRSIYNFYISLNKWRSTFGIEINGTEGYGIVEGRGRSYGDQKYTKGIRWGWQTYPSQSASEQVILDNYKADDSFIHETRNVLFHDNASSGNELQVANEKDNQLCLNFIDSLYETKN